ncbi:unnamed protein product, partial [Meganyctiphanes norvegica]
EGQLALSTVQCTTHSCSSLLKSCCPQLNKIFFNMGSGGGALGCCGTFAQILVFLVNTVLFAGSVLTITGSVLLLKNDNAIVRFIDVSNPNQVAYIGMCVGAVTAFVTFFGCAGSMKQSKFIIKLV